MATWEGANARNARQCKDFHAWVISANHLDKSNVDLMRCSEFEDAKRIPDI